MTIRFSNALAACIEVVQRSSERFQNCGQIVIVRDVIGRLHLAVESNVPNEWEELKAELNQVCGPYFVDNLFVGTDMLAPEIIFRSQDLQSIRSLKGVKLLERALAGAEWGRGPLDNRSPTPPRFTFYGLKGGVGRSTALIAWARHLSQLGKRVLIIDLDLESPGVSSSLLAESPDYGIVDWLVEDALDNADDELLSSMLARSPLEIGTNGEVWIVPCGAISGRQSGEYMAKLARAHVEVPRFEGSPRSFAERLAVLIDKLEEKIDPAIVLLDSRAGLHDIAGIATTRLRSTTFLFAAASRQTWDGYGILLNSWGSRDEIGRDVRERLHVVAAQVPETGRESYLKELTLLSYETFSDALYEEAEADDQNAFNFDITAAEAPHLPIPIFWSRAFQDWNPLDSEVNDDQRRAAFGEFCDKATCIAFPLEYE